MTSDSDSGRLLRWVAFLITLWLAAPSPGRAEPAESDAYRAVIEQALLEFRYRNWPEARALFRRAHELMPSARTHRGIGVVSYEMRDYVEATRQLEAALADERQPLTAEQRREARRLVSLARTFVGRFRVKVAPADASLVLDGAPASLEPDGTLLLSFGSHVLGAERRGYASEHTEIEVQGGEQGEVLLALTPLDAQPSRAVEPAPAIVAEPRGRPSAAASEPRGRASGLRIAWGLGSATALLGAATLTTWLVGQRKLDDLDDACRERADGGDPCVRGAVSVVEIERYERASNVGLGLTAAALLATGVVAVLEWPRESQAELTSFLGDEAPGRSAATPPVRTARKPGTAFRAVVLGPGSLSLQGAF